MGRKVRHYPSADTVEEAIKKYCEENKQEIINYVVNKFGFRTFDNLRHAEYNMYFGLDCGWVHVSPTNAEMHREWRLDDKYGSARIFDAGHHAYNTQSVTIKYAILDYVLTKMGWRNDFTLIERLD